MEKDNRTFSVQITFQSDTSLSEKQILRILKGFLGKWFNATLKSADVIEMRK